MNSATTDNWGWDLGYCAYYSGDYTKEMLINYKFNKHFRKRLELKTNTNRRLTQ